GRGRAQRDGGAVMWSTGTLLRAAPRVPTTSPLHCATSHAKESSMPAGPKRRTPPQERHAFGLTILSPSHPEVRRLQHDAAPPSLHGHKVWPTSFVLLDYLH